MRYKETAIKLCLFAKGRYSLTSGDHIEKLNQPAQLSCSGFCHVWQKALTSVLTVQNSLNLSSTWLHEAHAESEQWMRPGNVYAQLDSFVHSVIRISELG